ncbi:MAG: hypothetical protein K5831_13925, partial [Brevundimonas sp.]|uniref:hypothetical protein n=1 Tax=Brevundimonas sp. TaxID=1871086 RepID=UPI0025844AD9
MQKRPPDRSGGRSVRYEWLVSLKADALKKRAIASRASAHQNVDYSTILAPAGAWLPQHRKDAWPGIVDYSTILATTPAPTVRPPS